jgi:peptide deformylase
LFDLKHDKWRFKILMIMPLRLYGDPILRRRALPVTSFDADLAELARNMHETLQELRGVGLAGPQVGVPKRIFIAQELVWDEEGESSVKAEHVLVNPRLSQTRGEQVVPEGCLSLPGLVVDDMRRFDELHVEFQDLNGEWHALEAQGHFAQVIQHENDHLDGVLYPDRLPAARREQFMAENRRELLDMQHEAREFLRGLRKQKS